MSPELTAIKALLDDELASMLSGATHYAKLFQSLQHALTLETRRRKTKQGKTQ